MATATKVNIDIEVIGSPLDIPGTLLKERIEIAAMEIIKKYTCHPYNISITKKEEMIQWESKKKEVQNEPE